MIKRTLVTGLLALGLLMFPAGAAAAVGDGMWLVPDDIAPGTYVATAPADGEGCYWARSSTAEGDIDSLITNDSVVPGSHVIVTIADTDRAFESDDCGEWTPAPASGPVSEKIGEGTWAVGIDIAPGTYAAAVPPDSTGCYWERMSDFSGEDPGIITNNILDPGAAARVTIRPDDVGFQTTGCGTWTRHAS